MPQEQQIPLETPEFDVRTGAPIGAKQGIPKKTLEISDVKTTKGKWLKDKLSSLYNDPKYKTASPEQQKAWKSLAYDKWVDPYYKQILKTNAPTKEEWLSNHGAHVPTFHEKAIAFGTNLDKEIGLHTMKTTTDITAGLLRNVADGLDYVSNTFANTIPLANVVRKGSQFVEKKGEDWQLRLDSQHNMSPGSKPAFKNDIPGRMSELGTQAIFFEATGAGKAAKIFNVANPKTAGLALQMAKASWNGAVDFAAWSASQGETPSEIGKSAVSGAVLGGVLKTGQRVGLDPLFGVLKSIFKWGGKDATQHIISEALIKISGTELKTSSPLSEQSRKVSTIAATELDKYSVEKFKRPFKDLGYIQKQHVLNKLLAITVDAAQSAKTEGMPKQLIQAQAKEQDELMAAIFPEAKASQQKVEEFVKQSGLEPQSTKLLATLPHHNTTIDSPWKHLQARASFLRNKARQAKGEERKAILQAYNEEFALMKEKAAREKVMDAAKRGEFKARGTNDIPKEEKEKLTQAIKRRELINNKIYPEGTEYAGKITIPGQSPVDVYIPPTPEFTHEKALDQFNHILGRAPSPLEMRVIKTFTEWKKLDNYLIKLMNRRDEFGGTVGGAAANDPKAFHGESFVVTPYIDPYNTGFGDWNTDSFAQSVAQSAKEQALVKGSTKSFLTDAINNSFMIGRNLSRNTFLQEGTTKQLLHDQFGVIGGINYLMQKAYHLGENSGFKGSDALLFINWLSMRPNVVARVWNVSGGGQALFLHAAQEAERAGAGIALIPYDASKSFYEKMGMHEVGSYMAMTHTEIQNLLKNRGLLMMLLGAGITYGANKELTHGDYSVKGVN
jgi:hypothetical protein